MKANEVTVGTKLWAHGYQWEVTSVTYDPRGNAGMRDEPMPRYVFTARAVGGHGFEKLPGGYRNDMTLGYRLDADVTI